MPGNYTKKKWVVAEAAPYFFLTDRITDLLLDMTDHGKGPSQPQRALLSELTAEAHLLALNGKLPTERRRSRIWDAPPAPKQSWYERDEATHPLPVILTKTFRLGGMRVQ